jgi:hypothetical protein
VTARVGMRISNTMVNALVDLDVGFVRAGSVSSRGIDWRHTSTTLNALVRRGLACKSPIGDDVYQITDAGRAVLDAGQ